MWRVLLTIIMKCTAMRCSNVHILRHILSTRVINSRFDIPSTRVYSHVVHTGVHTNVVHTSGVVHRPCCSGLLRLHLLTVHHSAGTVVVLWCDVTIVIRHDV